MIGTYIKLGAGLALLAAFVWLGAAIYSAGEQHIQLKWDADKAEIQAKADAAIAKATQDKETALANNEGIRSDLQTQLDSVRNLNTSLSERLRIYSAAGGGSVPKAGDKPGVTPAPDTSRVGRLNDALGAALNECYGNRLKHEALIRELKPQL
jgi:hypothetical protein